MPNVQPPPRKIASRRKAVPSPPRPSSSFSLTLLAAGIAVLTGLVPLHSLSLGERVDVGALLFVDPARRLMLGRRASRSSRIALRSTELPEPRRQQAVRWSPGRREGSTNG